jgi:hypothetical protein
LSQVFKVDLLTRFASINFNKLNSRKHLPLRVRGASYVGRKAHSSMANDKGTSPIRIA